MKHDQENKDTAAPCQALAPLPWSLALAGLIKRLAAAAKAAEAEWQSTPSDYLRGRHGAAVEALARARQCLETAEVCHGGLPIMNADTIDSIQPAGVGAMAGSDSDPYDSDDYQQFGFSMVPHCHCHESLRPCDGVLAGGLCDGQHDDPREMDDLEYRVNPWGDDE